MGKVEALAAAHREEMLANAGIRPGPEVVHNIAHGPYDGFTRLAGAGMLPIGRLQPDPDQIRTEFNPDELDQLAASIKKHGILAPLRVRWDPGSGTHVIIVGERRYRGALKAGLEMVPCIIVEGDVTPKDILESQIAENCIRADISPIDQAHAFRRYMDIAGVTGKELAGLLHVSTATVSRALSLLTLPSEVQTAVETGAITPTAASEIARIKNPAVQHEVVSKAVEAKTPVAEVHREVRQKLGPAAPKARVVKDKIFRVERGLKVIVSSARPITPEDVIFALDQAMEQARAEDNPDSIND